MSAGLGETEWTRRVCEELTDRLGCVVLPLVASMMQQPGWPDRYVMHVLWDGWLEFKGRETLVSTAQRRRMIGLDTRRPGSARVVRLVDRRGLELRVERPDGSVETSIAERTTLRLAASLLLHLHSEHGRRSDLDRTSAARDSIERIMNCGRF